METDHLSGTLRDTTTAPAYEPPASFMERLDQLHAEIRGLSCLLRSIEGGDGQQCRPFYADGSMVLYVDVEQLAKHVPREPDTLIDWAKKGVIPSIYIPGKSRKGKGSWMFDMVQVKRALDRYRYV